MYDIFIIKDNIKTKINIISVSVNSNELTIKIDKNNFNSFLSNLVFNKTYYTDWFDCLLLFNTYEILHSNCIFSYYNDDNDVEIGINSQYSRSYPRDIREVRKEKLMVLFDDKL